VILTVTLNLAVDVTYHVPRVRWGTHNRVLTVGHQAGGKGVNVARVLQALGHEVAVTGLVGGATGAAARSELTRSGLVDATVSIGDESRTTIVVVEDGGEVTGLSESGPHLTREEWQRFVTRFGELVLEAGAVALSGSLPPGTPIDAYAQLIAIAARGGVPVLLDAEGDALARGVSARPELVKINAAELETFAPGADPLTGALRLREAGARDVVITEGPGGLLGVTGTGAWRAVPPTLVGNPTGAGDAAAAALVAGFLGRRPWPERLADAAALSAASVRAPLAGSFDEPTYRRLRGEIVAHRDHGAGAVGGGH
jgi:tagatose 6-phosphate kinase